MGREEKTLERIVKGFANHRRIEMLRLLQKAPGLSLEELTLRLRINNKTGAEHLRRLALAGLVYKKYEGRRINVRVSARGQRALASLPDLLT